MQAPQVIETDYFYMHRMRGMGRIDNQITPLPFRVDVPQLAEIADFDTYRSRKESLSHPQENELAEHDFSLMLMAQDILGEQRELPEDFIEPLNTLMSKVGKNRPSKPRF